MWRHTASLETLFWGIYFYMNTGCGFFFFFLGRKNRDKYPIHYSNSDTLFSVPETQQLAESCIYWGETPVKCSAVCLDAEQKQVKTLAGKTERSRCIPPVPSSFSLLSPPSSVVFRLITSHFTLRPSVCVSNRHRRGTTERSGQVQFSALVCLPEADLPAGSTAGGIIRPHRTSQEEKSSIHLKTGGDTKGFTLVPFYQKLDTKPIIEKKKI